MTTFPMSAIKKNNYSKIFHLIYQMEQLNEKLSKQEIALQTNLSLPTVTQNLKKLLDKTLIIEDGKFSSKGGRKAVAYSLNRFAKIALGIEIFRDSITIVAIDLLGTAFAKEKRTIAYQNDPDYYQRIATITSEFIKKEELNEKNILGMGFGIQGLVSAEGTDIIYGTILQNTGLSIDVISHYFEFPCRFVHDAESVALAEQWKDSSLKDALILSIGEHLGGALIIDGQLYNGANRRSGTIEHTVIDPKGPMCYCGKKGCVEVFCSLHTLTVMSNQQLDSFMSLLRSGDIQAIKQWSTYLNSLAIALNNFHMFLDNKIILGGEILHYFTEEDLVDLRHLVQEKNAFPESENLIFIGKLKNEAVATGAALTFVRPFLDTF
ncbi:ROK family transcriptional regulator [Carnobacterium antarcticum]|uniref:ROK family transcriptional regulator n=1 Tax=Carnobacterium antarcticum TaxID=2126436 RepID=A0ABW4NLU0_9LACT|nr:ROK family transcriptional regulator [Carnobacterium sp. CP1]ALV21869.1 N-acetyl-glucosamine kinase 2, ROK family [Carnobacterium sp. CP1]